MFETTKLQRLNRGNHMVVVEDRGDGSGTFCLAKRLLASKFLPSYAMSYEPLTVTSSGSTMRADSTMSDLAESRESLVY